MKNACHCTFVIYRTLRDYAKWQLLMGTILFVDLQASEFHDYLHKNRFLKLHELGDTQTEICVRTVEVVMPYAVIRRFADNFISDDLRKRVSLQMVLTN